MEMNEKLENFNKNGSNWRFKKVLRLEIQFVRWKPLGAGSWMPLPKCVENKKAIVNLKNFDNECFKWAATIGLKKLFPQNAERITRNLVEQSKEFDWGGISFPTMVDEIWKFEKRNHVSVNVYYWDGFVKSLKVTNKEKERHVDLFLVMDEETGNSHYCTIKNFSRLVSSQVSKRQHKVHVCKRCLFAFYNGKDLTQHKVNCREFKPVKNTMPKKGEIQKLSQENVCSCCCLC